MNSNHKPDLKVLVKSPQGLGHAISRFRKLNELTQESLADGAGLRQAGVSEIERGSPGVRMSTLFKILAALNLELVLRKRRTTEPRLLLKRPRKTTDKETS